VLVDDCFVMIESLAINPYLAQKYGGPLAPATLHESARVSQWSFWVVTEVEKPLTAGEREPTPVCRRRARRAHSHGYVEAWFSRASGFLARLAGFEPTIPWFVLVNADAEMVRI
jgi:glutathione S-transferase